MTYNPKYRAGWILLAVCFISVLVMTSSSSNSHTRNVAASIFDVGSHRSRQSGLEEPKWNGSQKAQLADNIHEEHLTGRPLLRHRKTVNKQLQSCSHLDRPGGANILINVANPEGTMCRLSFQWFDSIPSDRFNPNVIPYPPGSQYPYMGIALQSLMSENAELVQQYTIVYCDMDWASSDVFDQRMLTCMNQPKVLELPDWLSPEGTCTPLLEPGLGHIDPRIFMSPIGEPLMMVSTIGHTNCEHEFVVDLRTIVPDLGQKLNVETVPIRFGNLTVLPNATPHAEMEKNYQLLFDDNAEIFVHRGIAERSLTSISDYYGMHDLAVDSLAPECILSLGKSVPDPDRQKVTLEQATNSLRVTLCEYPCEPTLDNTVLMSIMHVKYVHLDEVYYRRYVVIMNATAPFRILARSSNLIYMGSDERATVFTVAMEWDHSHFRDRSKSFANPQKAVTKRAADVAKLTPDMNSLVNDYYHGWLDDTVMITLGVNDQESAFTHINASQLLDCLELCPQ
ncbi:hypothetical protein V1520DRAFT_393740 [Lipomyces starkeyi]|uniref:Uncharacterized protein n=1 Tax=Lipomyces starkeyi NRRL Y-11557 TaxID=675824 RepID=A0A1E3PXV3_LIPST|nr:hypothetical protein LIPSTDRAFT_75300 [Lipomyces starkeyi NRRL Y-11557]